MITGIFRFIEKAVPLAAGLVCVVLGLLVAVNLPSSSNKVIGAYLVYLLFHTAAMLVAGFYLQKFKRFWALSWFGALTLFFVVAIVFRN
jgi:uncharacterized membrane protein YgdD (TMEM256/DUF423 family)